METTKCEVCGKTIEGYSERHVRTLLAQHMFKHENQEWEIKKQKEKIDLDDEEIRILEHKETKIEGKK